MTGASAPTPQGRELVNNGLVAVTALSALEANDTDAYEMIKESVSLQERYDGMMMLSRTLVEVFADLTGASVPEALAILRSHYLDRVA